MLFYNDVKADKIVYQIGQFKNGKLKVNDPEHIEYMKRHYKYDDKLTKDDLIAKSGGWYEFPDGSNARGDDVEDELRRWNNECKR